MPKLLPHIPPETLAEPFVKAVDLSDEGKKILLDGDSVEVFLQALIDAEEIFDAVRVLARALHPQLAVAWSLDCASKAPPEDDDKKNKMTGELLELAQNWLDEPGDTPLRREAMVAAEESAYFGPASWVAAAIGWSGGSIAPITAPPLEAPEGLCARAASGAINITASKVPEKIMERVQEYFKLGLDYAQAEPPKGSGPTTTIESKALPAADDAADSHEEDAKAEQQAPPAARSLRRSPGAPTVSETPKAAPPPPEPSPRSLRRKPPGQSGSGWGSSGDSGSGGGGGGGGWNPKPL
ncbi:MAG: hypothetical protein ACI89L_001012 [Phycisphaerales bacterium]|jgi:hypothetical protein